MPNSKLEPLDSLIKRIRYEQVEALGAMIEQRHCPHCQTEMTILGCCVDRGHPFFWCPADGTLYLCDGTIATPASVPTVERCEHGVVDGDWCEPCHKEITEARSQILEGESR